MLETRSRLNEELTRRLTRWRNTAVPIVQAALAVAALRVVQSWLRGESSGLDRLVDGLIGGVTGLVVVGVFPRSQGRCPDSQAPSEYASQPHGETGHHIQADPRRDLDTPVVTNARKPPDRSPTGLRNTVGGSLDAVPSQTRI